MAFCGTCGHTNPAKNKVRNALFPHAVAAVGAAADKKRVLLACAVARLQRAASAAAAAVAVAATRRVASGSGGLLGEFRKRNAWENQPMVWFVLNFNPFSICFAHFSVR